MKHKNELNQRDTKVPTSALTGTASRCSCLAAHESKVNTTQSTPQKLQKGSLS